jgi:hypothetical protein
VLDWILTHNNPVKFVDPDGLAPGDEFDSIDKAAIDAIDYCMSRSVRDNVEYGGYIYQINEGVYSYTEAVPGQYRSIDITTFNAPPEGSSRAAIYHTHQADDRTSNFFSMDDRLVAIFHKMPIYFGTPKDLVKVFTPGSGERTVRYGR